MLLNPGKISRLPRHQKLRKIVKLLEDAERKIISGVPRPLTIDDIKNIFAVLIIDDEFDEIETDHFKKLLSVISDENSYHTINSARNTLIKAIGKSPSDWDLITGEGVLDKGARRVFRGMFLYLEDVRSPFNVGSIFRAAESFGIEKIFLSPFCADPRHKRAIRTSGGCVDIVPYERASINEILETGKNIFALETGGKYLSADDKDSGFYFPKCGIMILGSEELGVSPAALKIADSASGRLTIKTFGAKGSLNLSVAAGIALNAWANDLMILTINDKGVKSENKF
jgi:TrmH family RNA methyltransferase